MSGRSVILLSRFDLSVQEISVFLQSDCLFLQLLPSVRPGKKRRKRYHVLFVLKEIHTIIKWKHTEITISAQQLENNLK